MLCSAYDLLAYENNMTAYFIHSRGLSKEIKTSIKRVGGGARWAFTCPHWAVGKEPDGWLGRHFLVST